MDDALSLSRPFANHLNVAARVVSDVLSPAVMAIPCMILGVVMSDEPGTYLYALLYFLVAIPLPVAYVVWMVKSGRATDFHLPERRDRLWPFVVSIASAAVAVGLLLYFGAPAVFVAPVVAALAQTAVLLLITLTWQISIHTATTAALATYAALALGGAAAFLSLLVPLVAWARIYLGRHTLAQTVAGALLGCAAFTTLFALRGIAW